MCSVYSGENFDAAMLRFEAAAVAVGVPLRQLHQHQQPAIARRRDGLAEKGRMSKGRKERGSKKYSRGGNSPPPL